MRGSCLCGAVQYQLESPARNVVTCHCLQCRKTSGHYVAATRVDDAHLTIIGEENLTWFKSSDTANRAFCKTCGSQMFWRNFGSGGTSVMAGTLDGSTGLCIEENIFTETKGDYYDLPQSLVDKA